MESNAFFHGAEISLMMLDGFFPAQQRYHKQDKEQHETYFGYSGSGTGQGSEAENTGD